MPTRLNQREIPFEEFRLKPFAISVEELRRIHSQGGFASKWILEMDIGSAPLAVVEITYRNGVKRFLTWSIREVGDGADETLIYNFDNEDDVKTVALILVLKAKMRGEEVEQASYSDLKELRVCLRMA
jgi:hypothetical protein